MKRRTFLDAAVKGAFAASMPKLSLAAADDRPAARNDLPDLNW